MNLNLNLSKASLIVRNWQVFRSTGIFLLRFSITSCFSWSINHCWTCNIFLNFEHCCRFRTGPPKQLALAPFSCSAQWLSRPMHFKLKLSIVHSQQAIFYWFLNKGYCRYLMCFNGGGITPSPGWNQVLFQKQKWNASLGARHPQGPRSGICCESTAPTPTNTCKSFWILFQLTFNSSQSLSL